PRRARLHLRRQSRRLRRRAHHHRPARRVPRRKRRPHGRISHGPHAQLARPLPQCGRCPRPRTHDRHRVRQRPGLARTLAGDAQPDRTPRLRARPHRSRRRRFHHPPLPAAGRQPRSMRLRRRHARRMHRRRGQVTASAFIPPKRLTSMRRAAFTGVLLLMSGSAAAQQRFEVASVKPHPEDGAGTGRSGIEETQSAVRIENLPLWVVVRAAYGVTDSALIAPGWLKDARFDITAKPPAGYTHAMLGPLLQTLLAERFGMQAHREERPLNAYALRVARGGAKLKESTGPRGYLTGRPGLIAGNARTVKELAGSLAGQLKTAVADET